MFPMLGMIDDASSDHVHVNVDHAAHKVRASLNSRRMVAVLPEGAAAPPALVKLLCHPASDELHGIWNDIPVLPSSYQEVDVIGRHGVIQNLNFKTPLGFIKPGDPCGSVFREFQKKLPVATAMGDMPDVPGKKMAVGSGHDVLFCNCGILPPAHFFNVGVPPRLNRNAKVKTVREPLNAHFWG